jgi:hypothetical protein
MKYDITHVLPLLYPGVSWSLVGDQLADLNWPNEVTRPTQEEIDAKIAELQAAEAMRLLRKERDRRLAEVDWVTLRAYRSGVAVPTEWAAYMQALADLPATTEPQLNEYYELDLASVTWPSKPVNT